MNLILVVGSTEHTKSLVADSIKPGHWTNLNLVHWQLNTSAPIRTGIWPSQKQLMPCFFYLCDHEIQDCCLKTKWFSNQSNALSVDANTWPTIISCCCLQHRKFQALPVHSCHPHPHTQVDNILPLRSTGGSQNWPEAGGDLQRNTMPIGKRIQ